MTAWQDDVELFRVLREKLCTGLLSDIMYAQGFPRAVLPEQIRPLARNMVMAGRAMPVQDGPPVEHPDPASLSSKPFGLMFASLDDIKANEVYISTGGATESARLGGLLVSRAHKLGAAGVIVDSGLRNCAEILAFGIPAFSRYITAYGIGPNHHVIDFRCSITIGETRIKPGDLIMGDCDGVCVIPKEFEQDIIFMALEKKKLEAGIQKGVNDGMSVVEAFQTYGVM